MSEPKEFTERSDDYSCVIAGEGYNHPGKVLCNVTNTGNGYIAHFPANNCTRQDYYVCLDYAQAHDLILALSMFKKELGFAEPEKFNKGGWHPIAEIKCHYGNYYARLK